MRVLNRLILILVFNLYSAGTDAQYWARFQGGIGNDGAGDIACSQNGEVVFASWFSAIINVNTQPFASNGGTDILISKLSANGTYQWVTRIGGSGDDRALAITTDNAGNIYAGGYFSGSLTAGSNTINSVGGQDAFIVKLDAAGAVQWLRSGGGILNDAVTDLVCDAAGNIFCSGNFTGVATFNAVTLTSLTDPVSFVSSQDIFIGRYDTAGALIWMKQGGSRYADQSVAMTSDPLGDIYITGQFSDTVTFDVQHPTTLLNAIFIVKYSGAGNELWYNMASGGAYSNIRGITSHGTNSIFLTGESSGNTVFFGTPSITASNPRQYRVFIAKYDLSGNPLWVETDGSDSPVSAAGIVTDLNGGIYFTGLFHCRFNEYADIYGQATFNSVGFNDVFITKYDSTGTHQWSRSAGGPGEDAVEGIALFNVDSPVVCGTYNKRFSFPVNPLTFTVTGLSTYNPGSGAIACGDSAYAMYRGASSIGGTDIFLGKLFALDRKPYNYFKSAGNLCLPDPVNGCVSTSNFENVCQPQGPNQGCGGFNLFAVSNTSTNAGFFSAGPEFNYQWNTGASSRSILVNSSGTYTATITTTDGCFSSVDSLAVTVNQIPSQPTISDSKNFNINASFTTPITFCAPDSVMLWATNVMPGITVSWLINGVPVNGDTIVFSASAATAAGAQVIFSNAQGCTSTNAVTILVSGPPDTIHPYIFVPDTMTYCNEGLDVRIRDSLNFSLCPITNLQSITWTSSPVLSIAGDPDCPGLQHVKITPAATGLYILQAMIIRSSCGFMDTTYLTAQTYIQMSVPPVLNANVTGNTITQLCPGDTLTYIASGGNTYSWDTQAGASPVLKVTSAGTYCCEIQADSNGCSVDTVICRQVINPVIPVISSTTLSAVLCPGDSVKLFVTTPGIAYNWSGPGLVNVNTDTIYAVIPGDYYCNVTNADSCTLNSNLIEVVQYTSPFISITPSTVFCEGDTIKLEVVSSGNSIISWDFPLSGSNPVQFVQQGGQYSCSISSCGITTQDTVILSGITVAPFITQQDTAICYGDSVVLSPAGFSGTLFWIPDSVQANQLTVTQTGSYYAIATDPNGCTGFTNLVIVGVDSIAGPDTLLTNSPLCEGEQLMIMPVYTGPGIFNWIGPSGFASTQQDIIIDSIRTNQSGFYIVTVSEGGVCSSIPDSVNIIVYDSVPDYTLMADALCQGDTVNITADPFPSFNYSWEDPAGNTTFSASLQLLNYSSAQSGYYSLHIENGTCPSFTDSVFLGAPVSGNISIAPSDTIACNGDSISINAIHSSGTLNWNIPGNSNPVYMQQTGNVWCILTDNSGCMFYSDTLALNFLTAPSAVVRDTTVCEGTSPQLNAIVTQGSSSQLFYAWIGPLSFSSAAISPVLSSVNSSQAGSYTLTVSDSMCTAQTVTMNLVVNAVPAKPQLSASVPECLGDSLSVNSLAVPGVSYSFMHPDGSVFQGNSFFLNTTSFQDTGYYVCFAYVNACPITSDSIQIEFDSCRITMGDWFIPNIFSPNNDNINDFFIPLMPAGEDGQMRIYNRWGDLVTECRMTRGWDGKNSKGEDQVPGVYFWIMIPEKKDSTIPGRNGFVELVR